MKLIESASLLSRKKLDKYFLSDAAYAATFTISSIKKCSDCFMSTLECCLVKFNATSRERKFDKIVLFLPVVACAYANRLITIHFDNMAK